MSENAKHLLINDASQFKALKKKPLIAWPTVLLQFSAQATIIGTWILCLSGDLSIWLGCLVNVLAYYVLFTPAHEAMHNSISSKNWVNSASLFILMQTVVPGSTGKFLGLMHMQHHRFTNDTLDPDHQLVANPANIFFLWFFWDFRYISVYLKNHKSYTNYSLVRLFLEVVCGFSLMGIVAYFLPIEVLLLWFIPSRIMIWLICLVFMYLPHMPHTTTHKENPYQATLIRKGWEWLLTPLMMYQNFHLVHHLYPTIPFYRYKKAWQARQQFHEEQNPSTVSAFQLIPTRSGH
ncbi:hypothetical protein A9Q99_07815 [Gammaproteobacteria bacterium 45_16_T64]|nr:hypothetical protein A9Q99_07815 [Gammaproteobacteria bacterium 45_16_T64]